MMKVTTLPDGTQLQYVKVTDPLGERWISCASSLSMTSNPVKALGFLPDEAMRLYKKLVAFGHQGLSLTNALPMSEQENQDSRRYAITSSSGLDHRLFWQGDCWSASAPHQLYTASEVAPELERLKSSLRHDKTLQRIDMVHFKAISATWNAAFDSKMERNGYREIPMKERHSVDAQNLRRTAIELADQAVRDAGDPDFKGWSEWAVRLPEITEPHDAPSALKNAVGNVAQPPFYIWANEDCANKSECFNEAKAIRLELFNEGGESVYIVDADGVEVVDKVIEAHEALHLAGYFAGPRNAEVNPEFPGAWMVMDPNDPEGYAIVGDDVDALILEARDHLLDPSAQGEDVDEPQAAATKLVEVRLSALTQVEYMEVVEVPANITQAEIDDLVNTRYRQVDGGDYTSDPEYWVRGACEVVDSEMPDATPTMMAFRTADGLHVERADSASQHRQSSSLTPEHC